MSGANPTISGTVVASGDGDMTKHHKGGALEADVSAADVELAAMNAKPSNVVVGCVAVLALISFACTVASASSASWTSMPSILGREGPQVGLFETCSSMYTGSGGGAPLTDGEYKPCWRGGDVTPAFKAPFIVRLCQRWARNEEKEPADSRNWITIKADNDPVTYECQTRDPDAATLPPTAAPTVAGEWKGQTDPAFAYAEIAVKNTKTEKGPVIVGLGFCATLAVMSVVAHFVAVASAITVSVISFFHNCCPTGKCPPVLPVGELCCASSAQASVTPDPS